MNKQMKISFRKADNQDMIFLLMLRKKTMDSYLEEANVDTSEAYHLARITEFYADSNIIVCNDEAIGLVKVGLIPESVHIRQLQILPEFQKRGIGAEVLAMVKRRAQQLKLPVTLNVLLNNPAMSLYLRNGFSVVSENEFESKLICKV